MYYVSIRYMCIFDCCSVAFYRSGKLKIDAYGICLHLMQATTSNTYMYQVKKHLHRNRLWKTVSFDAYSFGKHILSPLYIHLEIK